MESSNTYICKNNTLSIKISRVNAIRNFVSQMVVHIGACLHYGECFVVWYSTSMRSFVHIRLLIDTTALEDQQTLRSVS